MARKRERNLKKRIRVRKRTKESREKRKEGGRKTKKKKRREWHFTEMDHQIRTASQAYRAKIWAAFRYV